MQSVKFRGFLTSWTVYEKIWKGKEFGLYKMLGGDEYLVHNELWGEVGWDVA